MSSIGRILRWVLLASTLVPVLLIGGCIVLAIGAGIENRRHDVNDRAAAAADAGLRRPLLSTSGRVLFIAGSDTHDFYVVNVDGSGLRRLTHLATRFPSRPVVSADRNPFRP